MISHATVTNLRKVSRPDSWIGKMVRASVSGALCNVLRLTLLAPE